MSEKEKLDRYFAGISVNSGFIQGETLLEMMEEKEDFLLFDLRQEEDFMEGHIEGATHLWWHEVGSHYPDFPRNKTIIFVCYTGQSAAQITGALRVEGLQAYSLLGGIKNGWEYHGFPLVPFHH